MVCEAFIHRAGLDQRLTTTKETRRMQVCFQREADFDTALEVMHAIGLRSSAPAVAHSKQAVAGSLNTRASNGQSEPVTFPPLPLYRGSYDRSAEEVLRPISLSHTSQSGPMYPGTYYSGTSSVIARPSSGVSDGRYCHSISSAVSSNTMGPPPRPDTAWSLDMPERLGRLEEVKQRSHETFAQSTGSPSDGYTGKRVLMDPGPRSLARYEAPDRIHDYTTGAAAMPVSATALQGYDRVDHSYTGDFGGLLPQSSVLRPFSRPPSCSAVTPGTVYRNASEMGTHKLARSESLQDSQSIPGSLEACEVTRRISLPLNDSMSLYTPLHRTNANIQSLVPPPRVLPFTSPPRKKGAPSKKVRQRSAAKAPKKTTKEKVSVRKLDSAVKTVVAEVVPEVVQESIQEALAEVKAPARRRVATRKAQATTSRATVSEVASDKPTPVQAKVMLPTSKQINADHVDQESPLANKGSSHPTACGLQTKRSLRGKKEATVTESLEGPPAKKMRMVDCSTQTSLEVDQTRANTNEREASAQRSSSTAAAPSYFEQVDNFILKHRDRPPAVEVWDIPGYAEGNTMHRQKMVDDFILKAIDDPKLLQLCETMEQSWKRFLVGS